MKKHENKTTADLEKADKQKQTNTKLERLQREQRKKEKEGHFITIDGGKTTLYVPPGETEEQVISRHKGNRTKL